jgi:hypothetical protein
MAPLESDELEQLMPNLQGAAQQQGSPGNTAALREYIHVGDATPEAPANPAQPPPAAERSCMPALPAGVGREANERASRVNHAA